MIRTPLLIEFTPSADSFEKKGFRGRGESLFKPQKQSVSLGPQVKKQGFGNPEGTALKYLPRAGGSLRLAPKAPERLDKLRQVRPLDRPRRLLAHAELTRSRLLVDHHDET